MSDAITFAETPESKATREAIDRLVVLSPDAAIQALHEIVGRQERDAIGAFRLQATPGGAPWEPNPEDYATFKRNILRQPVDQVGVQNGRLRQSISAEMNDAALEGRVGSSDKNARSFSEGGPINPLVFLYGRGRWIGFWFGEGQTAPGRRFLPTIEKATADAAKIVERILGKTLASAGLSATGAEG